MDSPSQRQASLAHADPSTRDTQAFRHGSSSEVRKGLETPPNLQLETERLTTSAVSMERRGVVAPVIVIVIVIVVIGVFDEGGPAHYIFLLASNSVVDCAV